MVTKTRWEVLRTGLALGLVRVGGGKGQHRRRAGARNPEPSIPPEPHAPWCGEYPPNQKKRCKLLNLVLALYKGVCLRSSKKLCLLAPQEACMTKKSRWQVVLTGLALALIACEQSITGVADPVFESVSAVAAAHVTGDPLIALWAAVGDPPKENSHDPGTNDILTIQGVTATDGGVVDKAFLFTGADFAHGDVGQFLEIQDASQLRPAEFTIDLWAQRLGDGQSADFSPLIQKAYKDSGFDGPGLSYFIQWNRAADGSNVIMADVAFSSTPITGPPSPRLTSGAVVDGEWVHVALTVDGARNITLYVNGTLESTFQKGSGTPLYHQGSIIIGNAPVWVRSSVSGFTFNGCIDEVRISRGALSLTQIQEIYGGGVVGACPSDGSPPEIAIDITPGSNPNSINMKSRSVIPVAILGSDVFDVTLVDVTTLAFGPDGAGPAHKAGGHVEDVNDDGLDDLVSHYRTQESGLSSDDEQACVTGELFDGTPFSACDTVSVNDAEDRGNRGGGSRGRS